MLKLQRQGPHLAMRNEKGDLEVDSKGKAVAAVAPNGASPETWRRALKKLTRGGMDIHERLLRIGMGEILISRGEMPDGTEIVSEPQVPTPEVQRAALMNLHEMMFGKAVAETEVNQSEVEAAKRQALEAMSEADLLKIIEGEYKQLEPSTEREAEHE